jgi:hypothetical protein
MAHSVAQEKWTQSAYTPMEFTIIATKAWDASNMSMAELDKCNALRLRVFLFWARQVEAVGSASVSSSAHAPDRAQLIGVDLEIVEVPIVNVETYHFAEHQISAGVLTAYFNQ